MHVLIESFDLNNPLAPQLLAQIQHCRSRGYDTYELTPDQIPRFNGPFDLAIGSVAFVHRALERAGARVPDPIDYPESLRHHYGRDIVKTTLGHVQTRLDARTRPAFFLKPWHHRAFGARLCGQLHDIQDLWNLNDDTPVWTSSFVDILSEFRQYVLEKKTIGLHHYAGEPLDIPDRDDMLLAIKQYQDAPAAYGIDWAVIQTQDGIKTVIIEVNDGIALGNYGLHRNRMFQMYKARWDELVLAPKNLTGATP